MKHILTILHYDQFEPVICSSTGFNMNYTFTAIAVGQGVSTRKTPIVSSPNFQTR